MIRIQTTVSIDDGVSMTPRKLSIERCFDEVELAHFSSPEWVATLIGEEVGNQVAKVIREATIRGSK